MFTRCSKDSLIDLLLSQGSANFTGIKIHLEFTRDVCTHTISGKEYEAACRRFLALTRKYETLGATESRLVLVLTTDGTEYFKDHPYSEGGVHNSPLIGVISLDPKPAVVSVGADIEEKWGVWIEKHPTMTEKGIDHMKSRPGGPSVVRVPRKASDTIFTYPVSHNINLEAHSITVRFPKGSMGFIDNGLLELVQRP